jgi:hypothetical protein
MASASQEEKAVSTPSEPQKKGWTALKRFFRGGPQQSVMRLNPFHLFDTKPLALVEGTEGSGEVYKLERYTHCQSKVSVDLLRRCEANAAILTDIRRAQEEGIDNTGNFHWPAEEVLTHLLLTRSLSQLLGEGSNPTLQANAAEAGGASLPLKASRGATVLELGAGLGLASIFAAHQSMSRADKVKYIATDGNSKVVELLQRNRDSLARQFNAEDSSISVNGSGESSGTPAGSNPGLDARLLRWDVPEQYEPFIGSVDYIIGADCLFFEKFHDSLVNLVASFFRGPRVTSPEESTESLERANLGVALAKLKAAVFVAPSRGGSLQRWVQRMRDAIEVDPRLWGLAVEAHTEFDSELSAMAQAAERTCSDFDADRHRPLLVLIRWKFSES